MEVILYPDRILRQRCEPVREIDDETFRNADGMLECMYESEGLGLAAPQVGWTQRIVTLDPEGERSGERIFVNPRLLDQQGQVEREEGCLSLPGIWIPVVRAEKVVVSAYTLRGRKVEIEAEGLVARAWQHELDHLNGTLIIDRVPATTRMRIRSRLKELEEQAAEKETT